MALGAVNEGFRWLKIGRCGKAQVVGSDMDGTACMAWPSGEKADAPPTMPRCARCVVVVKRLRLVVT